MSLDFREISLKILNDVFTTRRWAKENIEANIKDIDEEHRDIKKVYELVYGVLRNKSYIDFYLSLYIQKPADDITLMNILRIGFYQIMYMDSIPPYAAIDVSVEMTKKRSHPKASGFVNAVLRNVLREKGRGIRLPGEGKAGVKERIDYLSVKYSYEKWMTAFLEKNFRDGDVESILSAGNVKPPVFLRVNTLKTTADDAAKALAKAGVETREIKLSKNCLLVEKGDPINTQAHEEGMFYVQDLASQLLGGFVDAKKGEAIIDIGSAPGGKAASFAIDSRGKAGIAAVEPNEVRLKVMERNFVRLGITNVEFIKHDATVDIPAFRDRADKVIVDAPCSALGVIRRHPEKKWCLTEAELKEFPKLQAEILNTVKNWVKKGGWLYYCTCTINPDENAKLLDKFMDKNDNFKLFDITGGGPGMKPYRRGKYFVSLPGNRDNMDGFFMGMMKRVK
jgi:16S rRNA (cytosine967-C5)-methyltransferase